MKTLLAIILSAIALTTQAAPAPVITSSTFDGTFCTVSWHHPTAKKFQIGISAEFSSRAEYPPVVTGTTNFTWTFPPRETVFEVAVRGMSMNPAFTNVTEWSNRVGHNRAAPSGPPNPEDTRFHSVGMASTFGETVSAMSTNILTLTWGYTGPVTPNHEFRVHQSGDLKTWTVIASIPSRATQGFTVPPLPRGFYKVSSVESSAPDVHLWSTITNLVMDP